MICLYIIIGLVVFAVWAHLFLYLGFGFVYKASDAEKERNADGTRVQPLIVYKVDAVIAFFVVLHDAALNIFYAVIDPHPLRTFKPVWRIQARRVLGVNVPAFNIWAFELVTGRLNAWLADPTQWEWRRRWACIVAIFLNTKDKNHIKGAYRPYRWMV